MIYLDNSATTYPKPREVVSAVTVALNRYGANPGRSGHKMSMQTSQMIYQARQRVAGFFHMDEPERVIFTPSCTYSLNMVIKGVLKKGDHAIISSLEHNAVTRPLEKLKENGIITYSVAKVYEKDNDRTIESFRECINERTRLIISTQASNVFGVRLPIERLCALAHQYGILFCVDAAQGAGVLPLDLNADRYDFVCCAGHKGLLGIMGTGLLLINNDSLSDTLIEGGTGSDSSSLMMPSFYPDRLEAGTGNVPGICGISAGVGFIERIGRERIYQKELSHISKVYDHLKDMKKIKLYTARPDKGFAPVLSFSVEGKDCETVSQYLDRRNGIAVRAGLHCAPLAHMSYDSFDHGTVRISPSYFTTDYDIKALIEAVYKFSKSV